MYKFSVRSWLQWGYFQLRQLSFLSLVMLSLGMTLILAQLPAMSQETDTNPSWMQQVEQGNQFYQNQQYTEALQIWQNLAEELRGDHLNQAMALSNLALVYQQLGQWQKAEQAVLRSRQLLEKVTNQGNRHDRILAQTLDIQGRLHLTKGQPEKALMLWQQSEQLYRYLENKAAIAQSQINQAQALQNLGNYVLAQKQLTQAIQSLQQEEDSLLQATGWRSLGNVLRQVGELKDSRHALLSAHKIAQGLQLKRLEAEILLDLGNLEFSEAQRLQSIGRTEDAERCTQLAHKYFQDVIQQTKNLPELQLRASLNDLAVLIERAIETKQFTLALERFPTLQPLIDSIALGHFSVYARLRYVQQGMKLLQADSQVKQTTVVSSRSLLAHTQTALQQAQQLQDQRAEAQVLGQLGELYASNQQWQEAKQLTQKALDLANTPDLMYQLQWQMGRLLTQQQDNQVGNVDQAIAHYTQAIQALDKVRYNLMPTNPDIQFAFRDHVEPVYRELVDLLLTTPTSAHLQESVQYVDALHLAELEDFLRCPISQRVPLNSVVDSQAVLLHAIVLSNRIVTIFDRPGQPLKYHSTAIAQKQAETVLQALTDNILKQNRPEEVIRDASQVYQWLIAPFESELEHSEIKTLVFTLDGALRNIPISVLYDAKREEYLVQKRYAIALTPGLNLFELNPLKREQLNILAAGISEDRTVENRKFKAIAHVEQELEGIHTFFASKSKRLLNSDFTAATLQQQIDTSKFTIIHLATHGAFSADPEATYILTFDRLIKSYDWNNLLKATSQTTLKPIDLLVMSACETAKGDHRATLGLAGIAVRTGAQSTISSLWKVNDQATATLMVNLYSELSKPNVTRSEALHRAQQALFNDSSFQYQEPFFWAAFVLVGNWL